MILSDVVACARMFDFLRQIVSPKTVHNLAKRSIKDGRCDGLYDTANSSIVCKQHGVFLLSYFLPSKWGLTFFI